MILRFWNFCSFKISLKKLTFCNFILLFRTLLSFLFPFGTYESISIKSGVVFSQKALVAFNDAKCSGLFFPMATEKALLKCVSIMGIYHVDPVDEVSNFLVKISIILDECKKADNCHFFRINYCTFC